jgi:dsRNA-specific ribonuclease
VHSRYRVHDTQRLVAESLRRNSAITPRYRIVDKTTGSSVDEYTTRSTAQYICADMNREHRNQGATR